MTVPDEEATSRQRPLTHLMYLADEPTRQTQAEDLQVCRICLRVGDNTKEHVPPRAAFNSYTRLWDHLVTRRGDAKTRKACIRGGLWVRSLCKQCNEVRGGRYANEYVTFVRDLVAAPQLFAADNRSKLLPVRASTLMVAKQIATMFLAIHSVGHARQWGELRRFVLDPRSTIRPTLFRVLAFLVPNVPEAGTVVRFHGRADSFAPGFGFIGAEISLYPFGVVFASDIGPGYLPDQMTDISSWFWEPSQAGRTRYVNLFTRVTGVDAIRTGLGFPRARPQIDYVGSDFAD